MPTAKGKPRRRARAGATVSFVVEEKRWRAAPATLRLVRRAVRATLATAGGRWRGRALTVLLAGDDRLKELNFRFRRKRKATNVLAFPSNGPYLGDVAIAYGVALREAREQGKGLPAHAAHLAAHGVLHLLGYDHRKGADALVMEDLEVQILERIGVPDPYRDSAEAT